MLRFIIFCFVLVSIVGCATLPQITNQSFKKGMTKDEIVSLFGRNPDESMQDTDTNREVWVYKYEMEGTLFNDYLPERRVWTLFLENDNLKGWKIQDIDPTEQEKLIAKQEREKFGKAVADIVNPPPAKILDDTSISQRRQADALEGIERYLKYGY